jgi:hypothetical protein
MLSLYDNNKLTSKSKLKVAPASRTTTKKQCRPECSILSNKCFTDCIKYISSNLESYHTEPNELVDDIYTIIEPRLQKPETSIPQPFTTCVMYEQLVVFAASYWPSQTLAEIKSIVNQSDYKKRKTSPVQYKLVKIFLKDVKLRQYIFIQQS